MAIGTNKYIYFTAVAIVFHLKIIALADPDARLGEFIKKLEATEGKLYPLRHPKNPLHPYIGRPFEEGLDAQQRTKPHQMQENGTCGLDIETMIETGLLDLYPFLKPAFEAGSTGYQAKRLLIFGIIPAYSRCLHYQIRREHQLDKFAASFDPIDFDGGRLFTLTHRPPGNRGLIWDKLRSQMHGLGNLAICADYPPSIADLMTVINKPGGIRLTKQETLYIGARARHHNLLTEQEFQRAISRLKSGPTYPDYNVSLLLKARHTNILTMPHIAGYWQAACRISFSIDLEK